MTVTKSPGSEGLKLAPTAPLLQRELCISPDRKVIGKAPKPCLARPGLFYAPLILHYVLPIGLSLYS